MAVDSLFLLCDFSKPTDFDDKENMGTTILHNLKQKEDITIQRRLLASEFSAELKQMSDALPTDYLNRSHLI